jgi:hypothetical protein
MSQTFSDSDYFDLSESETNTGGVDPNARLDGENYRLLELNQLRRSGAFWEFCPPYTVNLVQDIYTVATCGSYGYEAPVGELYISAPLGRPQWSTTAEAINFGAPWDEITPGGWYPPYILWTDSGLDTSLVTLGLEIEVLTGPARGATGTVAGVDHDGSPGVILIEETAGFWSLVTEGAVAQLGLERIQDILPAYRFVLLDPAGNPVDLSGWTVTFDVAAASGGHAWSVATTTTGTLGEVETTLVDDTVPAGVYTARFTLIDGDARLSVPTWPLELHIEGF